MKFPDEVLIQHIINECNKIQNILSEISYEKFLSVTMYQDALIRPLEVIGEAAGNLSAEFVEKNPAIPVSNMKGIPRSMGPFQPRKAPWSECACGLHYSSAC